MLHYVATCRTGGCSSFNWRAPDRRVWRREQKPIAGVSEGFSHQISRLPLCGIAQRSAEAQPIWRWTAHDIACRCLAQFCGHRPRSGLPEQADQGRPALLLRSGLLVQHLGTPPGGSVTLLFSEPFRVNGVEGRIYRTNKGTSRVTFAWADSKRGYQASAPLIGGLTQERFLQILASIRQ